MHDLRDVERIMRIARGQRGEATAALLRRLIAALRHPLPRRRQPWPAA